MKSLFLVALLISVAWGVQTSVQDQINALLQTGTKAADAIDTVLDLLRDLKEENFDAQSAADQKNETDEWIGQQTIAKFGQIQHLNQKLYSQSVENREHFENEMRDTHNYLAWNEARVDELDGLINKRYEHQCYSNQLFVRSLRLGQRTLDHMKELATELSGYIAVDTTGLAEVKEAKGRNIADKLKKNVDLYNRQEIKAFVRLAESMKSEEDESTTSQRSGTLAEQALQCLKEQEQNIWKHFEALKDAEVASSWELAEWVDLVRAEIAYLHAEHERQSTYADRLATQIAAALAQQAKSLQIVKESQAALDQAISDLETKRQAYAEAKAKRDEENIILDEVITMFKEQVRSWSGR